MAFGMKHWWGLTLVGIALVCIWRLPPSMTELAERDFVLPEVRRAQVLENDLKRTHEVLKHTRWSDSLSALTVATAVDGLVIGIPSNQEIEGTQESFDRVTIDEETRAQFRRRVEEEFAGLSPRADVAFGFFFVLAEAGSVPGVEYLHAGQAPVYVGERDGQAYCIQARSTDWLSPYDVQRVYRLYSGATPTGLGVCRPYLAYGLPGEHVGAWMHDGGVSFAVSSTPPSDPEWDSYRRFLARRSFFGLNLLGFGFRNTSIQVDRCMAGYPDGCEATLTDPKIIGARNELMSYVSENSPLLAVGSEWMSPFGSIDDYLLSDLEREFGEEAFRRFWLSDQEVPAAFEAAFGMPMGEWVVTWVETQMNISPPGPGLSKTAAMGGMLAMTLCAILAGAWARRRRVA